MEIRKLRRRWGAQKGGKFKELQQVTYANGREEGLPWKQQEAPPPQTRWPIRKALFGNKFQKITPLEEH